MASSGRGITRARERLACVQCRRRKLRCDRSVPCGSCLTRGHGDSCNYERLPSRTEHEPRSLMAARLEHLEQMVQHLMPQLERTEGNEMPVTAMHTHAALAPQTYQLNMEADSQNGLINGKTSGPECAYPPSTEDPSFRGATHWASVLDDIQELRLAYRADNMEDDGQPTTDPETTSANSSGDAIEIVLSPSAATVTLDYVLAMYLPPKQEVDRLTSAYFRAQAIAAPFIHAKHFQRLYQEFWSDPLSASPLWTSLLFSICHISINTLRSIQQDGHRNMGFSTAAAHCLAIGQYFRPKRFAVEALLLHIQSQVLTRKILSPDIAPLLGILIRTATMMGYHQTSTLPGLSVFEREMRRRIWSQSMQLDLLVSFHLGLPGAIEFSAWASDPPTSLSDTDFDEDTAELPPAKPDSEPTGIIFIIAKHRFMTVFHKILRHALTGTDRSGTDTSKVDALDAELRRVFAELPKMLQPRLISHSVFDPPSLVVARLCVLFLYCKCLCVLHRPWVIRDRPESIAVALEASSTLLRGLVEAYTEFGADGQVETEGWFMSSLNWHDFLLGVVTLCLATLASVKSQQPHEVDVDASIRLLTGARDVCIGEEFRRGKETARVHVLIDSTLLQLNAENGSSTSEASISLPTPDLAGQNSSVQENVVVRDSSYGANDSLWDKYLEEALDSV